MYQERAAIMEFDGGLPRAKAEAAARAICVKPVEPETAKPVIPGSGYAQFKAVLKEVKRVGH